MTYPTFTNGQVLPASDLNAIGLWLVKSQTIGSGVSSVTVTGAFSADYDNYKIVISGGVVASAASVGIQLNNSTGTTYRHYGYYGSFGTAALNAYAPIYGTSWTDAMYGNTVGFMGNIDLMSPYLAKPTIGSSWSVSTTTVYNFALIDTSTASNTGFTITPLGVGNNLTGGTISVYGYRK